jgi:hypothetical protein
MSKPVSVTLAVVDRMVGLVQELDRACTPPPLKELDPKRWRRATAKAEKELVAARAASQRRAIHEPGRPRAQTRRGTAGREILRRAESEYRRTDPALLAETQERSKKAKALAAELAELFSWHGPSLDRLSGWGKERAKYYAWAAAPQECGGLRAGVVKDLASIRLKLEYAAQTTTAYGEVLPPLVAQAGGSGSLPAQGRKVVQAAPPTTGERMESSKLPASRRRSGVDAINTDQGQKRRREKPGRRQRRSLPPEDEAKVLERCRRRCCVCFVLDRDASEKKGQLAHLDKDRSNNTIDNFVYLCFHHHDTYDSTTSQSKNLTEHEARLHQAKLHQAVEQGEVPRRR